MHHKNLFPPVKPGIRIKSALILLLMRALNLFVQIVFLLLHLILLIPMWVSNKVYIKSIKDLNWGLIIKDNDKRQKQTR